MSKILGGRAIAPVLAPNFLVKAIRRARPPTPWHWEIYDDGSVAAYRCSEATYRSAQEAWEAGQAALAAMVDQG